MKTKYLWILMVLIGLTACENDDEGNVIVPEVELTAGSADFTNYVSIGNSLTAGFMDNALFQAGQTTSIPNLLAQKFSLVGGGAFTQPLMNDNVGGLLFGGVPNPAFGPRLFINPLTLAIGAVDGVPTTEVFAPSGGPYNNLGVPGAKSFHLLFDGYGNPGNLALDPPEANPYYVRMASAPNATILGDALAQAPTFFSLWIGNNDVLGYATTGGDGSNEITPSDGPPGIGFNETYAAIIATLTSTGAQGVVANIPDVTALPFFTAVPYDALDPSNEDFADQIPLLNTIYGALNDVYAVLQVTGRDVSFSDDNPNPVVIKDESLQDLSAQIAAVLNMSPDFPAFIGQFGLPPAAAPLVANLLGITYGQARQATENDLLVLTSSSVIGTVNSENAAFLQSAGLPAELAAQFSAEGVS
ncbi:MAG: G-D-S-L family lipolytic protein, partial [Bacteroidia bacterium]|nr:G-D-S-L family lipolytic protein [Bacteroidia bacterium]